MTWTIGLVKLYLAIYSMLAGIGRCILECTLDESLISLLGSFISKYIIYWIEVFSLIGELGSDLTSVRGRYW